MQIRSGSQTTGHFDVFIPINVEMTDLQYNGHSFSDVMFCGSVPLKTDQKLIINIISEPEGTY